MGLCRDGTEDDAPASPSELNMTRSSKSGPSSGVDSDEKLSESPASKLVATLPVDMGDCGGDVGV